MLLYSYFAGTDKSIPKGFPCQKIHTTYVPYSSGGGQVLVHGDRDWSNRSDLFSALIPRVFNCKDRTYCTLFTPANTKMLHENNCVIILSVRGFERVEIRKEFLFWL